MRNITKRMNKKVLYIVVGVVVVGVVFAMVVSHPKPPRSEDATQVTTETPTSIRGLISSSASQKCTFEQRTEYNETSGVVYVSDGRMRGDYRMHVFSGDQQFQSHMIIDDGISYTWNSLSSQGFRAPMVIEDAVAGTVEYADYAHAVTFDQQLEYDCVAWKVNPWYFEVPEDIVFIDVEDMMDKSKIVVPQETMETLDVPDSMTDQCPACDALPDKVLREQCRLSFACEE